MNEVILQTLPLSVVMMAGPQILSAIIFLTNKEAIKVSFAYISAVALAAFSETLLIYVLLDFLGVSTIARQEGNFGRYIETIIIFILIFMSIKTYVNRATAKPPAWLTSLQDSKPKDAFRLGLGLILFMPTDIASMLTVALHLHWNNASFLLAIPFILATVLIAALPLIIYFLFKNKIIPKMDDVRLWIDKNNWIIQIAIYSLFIYMLWS